MQIHKKGRAVMSKKLKKSPEYSDFFNNLIDICDACGTSPTSLAEKFAAKSVLTAWKHGKIDVDVVSKLSLELNVSLEHLILGKENSLSISRLSKDEQELVTYYNKLPPLEKIKLVARAEAIADIYEEQVEDSKPPILSIYCSDNRVSAGVGEELYDYEQWHTVDVIETPQSRKADFMLIVDGESMSPKFHDGDHVLVRQQPAVELGQIGIFYVDGKGYIKKYDGDYLISLNPDYDDIYIVDKELRCFGLVLGIAELAE